MIEQVLADYCRTGEGEYAAHALELIGLAMREHAAQDIVLPLRTLVVEEIDKGDPWLSPVMDPRGEIRKTAYQQRRENVRLHVFTVAMALKAAEYLARVGPCGGDDWDKACRCDGLYTAWLLARYLLGDKPGHRQTLAAVRAAISEVEEAVPEAVSLEYVKKQPPLPFMGEAWNYGLWRSYYAKVASQAGAS